jgi:hypothetical protein
MYISFKTKCAACPYRMAGQNYCLAPWSTNKNILSFVYFMCKAVKLLLDSGLLTNEMMCPDETKTSFFLINAHTTPALTHYTGSTHTKPNHNPGYYTFKWITFSKGLYTAKT